MLSMVFFMSMRSKFVAEGVSIYYYLVDLGFQCLRLGRRTFEPRTLRFVLGTIVGAFTLTGSIIAFLKVLKEVDIVICTAAISGRWSPLLITSDAIAAMRAGTVTVDLAALGGGNCQ